MGEQAETALYLVLGAAFLHAFWNALIKGSTDSTLVLGLISLAHAFVGAVMVILISAYGAGELAVYCGINTYSFFLLYLSSSVPSIWRFITRLPNFQRISTGSGDHRGVYFCQGTFCR